MSAGATLVVRLIKTPTEISAFVNIDVHKKKRSLRLVCLHHTYDTGYSITVNPGFTRLFITIAKQAFCQAFFLSLSTRLFNSLIEKLPKITNISNNSALIRYTLSHLNEKGSTWSFSQGQRGSIFWAANFCSSLLNRGATASRC